MQALAIFAAGVVAGTVNVIVGSGTLVTFPVLLAFGYSPITANVSNTIGLVPGSLSGVYGYRRELRGQRLRGWRLCPVALVGGLLGALALKVLPESAFKAIVPVFIAAALVLVVVQPRLGAALGRHRGHRALPGLGAMAAVLVAGVYGGYFGAAQGILLLAILGISINDNLQRLNGMKNLLAVVINLTAGIVFIALFQIAWGPAALLAIRLDAVGGQLGARYGRGLSPTALRALIVVVGIVAIVRLLA